jgi:hypothetical protein
MPSVKSLFRPAAVALLALLAGTAQAVVINQYTNAAAWHAAVGSFALEDFQDGALQAPLQSITGLGSGPSVNGVVAGKLWDVIDQDLNQDTTFTFNPGVYGFGGIFDLAGPGGPGTEIIVRTSAGLYSLGLIPNVTANTFWGFTIDEALLDVYFTEGPNFALGIETYTMDNMVMATSLAVPEPATLALLGLGLAAAGLGFGRGKRAGRA